MINILLCGGSGTRLWPISRTKMPKQFVPLFQNKSLFELTLERNQNTCDKTLLVSNEEQYFLALDQLRTRVEATRCVLEPVGRNTAPAIALACLELDSDDIVLVTPSDHLIKDQVAYMSALAEAKTFAEQGFLVTFGITPSHPETGYGYIEAKGSDVKAFHEKPDVVTAQKYVESGQHFWNSGMFCFKAGVFLEELGKHSPEILKACESAFENAQRTPHLRIKMDDMKAIPSDSIDYAVMEKSTKVKVVSADIGWSDVGSFDALAQELENDASNNLIIANKPVELIDVEDMMIVDTDDALLVCKKGSSQKVKEVVGRLKESSPELTEVHQTAHRPWGTYTVLEDENGYKIKRIVVKPGKRLSLQKHYHRSEHWIVVSGTALVRVGDDELVVRPNESTYIPMGMLHRLENKGKIDLVLIEAQVGEYTGEDDIVRMEDDFAR